MPTLAQCGPLGDARRWDLAGTRPCARRWAGLQGVQFGLGAVRFYEMPASKRGASAKEGASDLFQLVVAYAKQETVDPVVDQVKALGRGLAGALLLSLGTVLLALGALRALQAELGSSVASAGWYAYAPLARAVRLASGSAVYPYGPAVYPYGTGAHLSGDLSWVPYMGGALFCLLVAGFAVSRLFGSRAR